MAMDTAMAEPATSAGSSPFGDAQGTRTFEGGGSEAVRHSEGQMAKSIEEQTARLPSDTFLWLAAASVGVSMVMRAAGKNSGSLFVGQWVAPFLLLGVYNKLVKVAGSDRLSR